MSILGHYGMKAFVHIVCRHACAKLRQEGPRCMEIIQQYHHYIIPIALWDVVVDVIKVQGKHMSFLNCMSF